MSGRHDGITFLLDVDNTLLDNDKLKQDIDAVLRREIGPDRTETFWQIYEQVREETDCVDYPTTVKRLAKAVGEPDLAPRLDSLLRGFPFRSYVYPGAFKAIDHMKELGTVVILSDGDSVFQPLKIRESGLEAAVDGNVLVYVHKEEKLEEVRARFPARHYVMVDDKPRILSVLEHDHPAQFTTILVLQGHYAHAGEYVPSPDWTVRNIGELGTFTREQFLRGAT